MGLGSKIADARKAKNMTQEQLAELMSVTRQSISRWESEQSYPEMDKIVYLAEILGVSCDYLLKDNCEKTETKKESGNAITRLLYGLKGKKVRLTFYSEAADYDLVNSNCVIKDFDGQWINVEYTKGKQTENKLLPVSSILSIKYVREGK
ncbi:helix-turn-helix transcriptional regulator [Clostridium sp. KNHs205]|jgi:transcriptional regulator with XRE-family HTH domain|uniref:helix-turn-helix domain-containing protein n=1 Tax=Clostridium sp. KNHs205 TaxID=1449050 RepID=UPI00068E8DFD|nr:helix-turn-helix transcriptional regulator [Clostridium sp. KNHs205]